MSLSTAAQAGDLATIQNYLMDHEVDLDQKDAEHALRIAASDGYMDIVRLLVENGVNIDAQDDVSGWSPLNMAIENDHLDIVAYLIQAGANLNIRDVYGQTLLHWSIDVETDGWKQGHRPGEPIPSGITELLIHSGIDLHARDNKGRSPLDLAISTGHTEVEKILRTLGRQ